MAPKLTSTKLADRSSGGDRTRFLHRLYSAHLKFASNLYPLVPLYQAALVGGRVRAMDTVHPDWERLSIQALSPADLAFLDRPAIATLYAISGVLLDLLGPMLWAALIVLLLQAEFLP
jgi:hypothetical protein